MNAKIVYTKYYIVVKRINEKFNIKRFEFVMI